jgi:GT2 family glycosyltransferase
MPRVAVIVVNWNGARHLPGCLAALANQTYHDFALWIVDNGSTDASLPLLDAVGPRLAFRAPQRRPTAPAAPVHLLRNAQNAGFAGGNNRAIREVLYQADCAYVVTLNNDTAADPQWLATLVAAADAGGPHMGMVASTLVFAHRPAIVQSAGIAVYQDGLALDARLGEPVAQLPRAVVRPVFGPSAGAALYRRELLLDVGVFDTRFGSYLEDVDLAWRARLRGWDGGWAPQARVRHAVSATGGQESPFKNFHLSRNRIWTVAKNMPTRLLRRWSPLIARYDLLALAYGLARRDSGLVGGRIAALRYLEPMLRDRERIQGQRRIADESLAALFTPALGPRAALRARTRLNALLAAPPASDEPSPG